MIDVKFLHFKIVYNPHILKTIWLDIKSLAQFIKYMLFSQYIP